MQISKLYLPLGAVAILSLSYPLHAQETDSQAKAREALRRKIAELNAQPEAAAPAAPVPPAAPAAPVVVIPPPPPVVVAPVAAPATVAVTTAAPMDDAATARAREALRQKMMEMDAQSGAAVAAAPGVTFTPTPVVAPGATTATGMTAATAAAGYKPIAVPASPLTGTKEARLAALLQQYKADLITPEQYHTQRAAIIAEP